jgi:tetratricopeptide (TPR) repeat protein
MIAVTQSEPPVLVDAPRAGLRGPADSGQAKVTARRLAWGAVQPRVVTVDGLDFLLGRATALNDEGNAEDALVDAQAATELDGVCAPAWLEVGRALWQLNRPQEALPALQRAINLDPSARTFDYLAVVFGELGRHEDALEATQRCLELDQETLGALISMGEALIALSRAQEAVEPLTTATELNPENWLAWSTLALAHSTLHQFDEALEVSHRGLEYLPERASLWHSAGAALVQLGRSEEAIEPLQRAIELDAESTPHWVTLGRAQLSKDDLKAAQVAYEEALAIFPYDPAPWRGLADCLRAGGHDECAAASVAVADALASVPLNEWP